MSRCGYWAVATTVSGGVGEKTKYWVDGEPEQRAKAREKAALRKTEQNGYAAIREFARLLNENFSAGDLLLGLDYSEKGMARLEKAAEKDTSSGASRHLPLKGKALGGSDAGGRQVAVLAGEAEDCQARRDRIRDAAEHELVNCIRRVKRLLEKEGRELRYAAVTSDMDGQTGEHVRVHHHLVVPAWAAEAFRAKWEMLGYGGVSWTPLWKDQVDRLELAEYLLRQVRRDGTNSYVTSRNLVRPKAKVRKVASGALLRVPKGCSVLPGTEIRPDAQYLRYLLPPEEIEAAEAAKRRRWG